MPWGSGTSSKPIKGLHLAFAVVGVLIVGGALWLFTSLFGWLSNDIASSRLVSDKVVAAVSSDWGRDTFDELATPEFVAAHARGKYDATRYFTLLGGMRSSTACDTRGLSVTNGVGWSEWHCPATFDSGEATLAITLQLKGGKWLMSDFAVRI